MSGYILRNAKIRQKTAEANGDYKPVEFFIDNEEYAKGSQLPNKNVEVKEYKTELNKNG